MREIDPACRFVWAEPLIQIAPRDRTRSERGRAENARQGQFEAYDMLLGRVEPELGGSEDVVDCRGPEFLAAQSMVNKRAHDIDGTP